MDLKIFDGVLLLLQWTTHIFMEISGHMSITQYHFKTTIIEEFEIMNYLVLFNKLNT